MRYLCLSFLVIITSCASYPEKKGFSRSVDLFLEGTNPYFSNEAVDYVYKASVNVYNNSFGGILIIKKITESQHRIVFTTEMGNKIFDFSLFADSFEVNYILEEIDKAPLVKMLVNDFRVLVTENLNIQQKFSLGADPVVQTKMNGKTYFYYYEDNFLKKVVNTKGPKEKIEFTFSEINDNIARNILIVHQSIDLTIELTSISTNE